MPVLADILADTVDGSFVGVFPVAEDEFYFVAVQNGTVLATCDRLIRGRERAMDEFSETLLRATWEFSFAPDDFGLSKTKERSLADVIGDQKPRMVLSPISSRKLLLKLAGIAMLLAVLFVGWGMFQEYQERAQQDEQQRLTQERELQRVTNAARMAADRASMQVQIPTLPWENQARFAAHLTACRGAMDMAPLAVPGWKPTTLTCTRDGKVSLVFTRDGGTINWVSPFVTREGFRPIVRTLGQNNVVSGVEVTWDVPEYARLARFPKDTRTAGVSEMRRHIASHSEEAFINVRLSDVPGVQAEIAGPNNQPLMVQVSRGLGFGFVVRHEPTDLNQILAPLPVAVLEKAVLDMGTWTWTIEGIGHERIPLPPDARPYVRQSSIPGISGR